MDYSMWIVTISTVLLVVYIIVQLLKGKCNSTASLEGKTIIVTGANTGIGYETALSFARRKGRVILACRSRERAEAACKTMKETSGNQNVFVKIIDLSIMASVRKFAEDFTKEEKRLDILVNNAAVSGMKKTMTEEGLEYSYATNYLGPFLLTNLLLDLMKKTPNSRIVNVSSIVNMFGSVSFDTLNGEKYSIAGTYYDTKLLNIMFTKELARKLQGTSVTTSCLHPGSVRTELLRNIPVFVRVPFQIMGLLFFKTCEEGAQTTIYCAISEDLQGVSGHYYMDCKDYEHTIWISKQAYDEGLCKKIWEVSERLTESK
ncbi:Hypothetical predicted protein [Mytilus galloprovincialis]|uniref:Uncharacterized protein n=1 Tax=Mytilus galloprovincialis TaxID=29158 RepID=A0A8B6FDL8_MYTGA|nr:Hypothetical predicted protein [Mytilus galloprovincialis]